jgi:microcystin-dependent protein
MTRYYSSVAEASSLSASITSGTTSVAVSSVTGFPGFTPYTLVIDPGLASEEIVTVTGVAGTTLSVTRGEDGTSAQAHSIGGAVRHMVTARDFTDVQTHMGASEAVHGLGAGVSVVGTSTTQTLTGKTISGASNTFSAIPEAAVTSLTSDLAALAVADSAEVTNRNAAILVATPLGMVVPFAGAAAPTGWLLCDGSAVSRTTYAGLFSVVSTAYGAGNGSTTFNVPNLKGKVVVGRDSAQTEFDTLGETGGEKTHTLTESEIPAHDHALEHASLGAGVTLSEIAFSSGSGTNRYAVANGTPTLDTADAGSGAAHNNLQPYMALNYIIKAA